MAAGACGMVAGGACHLLGPAWRRYAWPRRGNLGQMGGAAGNPDPHGCCHRSGFPQRGLARLGEAIGSPRSEEHTSELQSLMRISYAVFCLKKKKNGNMDSVRAHTSSSASSEHKMLCG